MKMKIEAQEAEKTDSNYGRIHVTLRGLSDLLMNKLTLERLKPKPKTGKDYDPVADAREGAYMAKHDGKDELYIPADNIYAMMIASAKRYSSNKVPLSSLLAGCMRIEPENVWLGTDKYEIDIRIVNIKGNRVPKARARVSNWSVDFDIVYDKRYIFQMTLSTMHEILEAGGHRQGLLDWRPQHKGRFGTFEVTKFQIEG